MDFLPPSAEKKLFEYSLKVLAHKKFVFVFGYVLTKHCVS